MQENAKLTKEDFWQCIAALLISVVFGVVGNFIGYNHVMPLESIPGMLIFAVISLLGWLLSKVILKKFPAFLHVSILAILATVPIHPLAPIIVEYTSKIQLMAVVTPILAYAGLTVGRDWKAFAKLGWKAIIVGLLVIFGTFFWSAVIAEVLMRVQGVI